VVYFWFATISCSYVFTFFLEGAYAELPQILLNFCFRPSSFGLPFPDIHVIDSLQLHVYKERSSIGSPIMTFIYGANTSNHPGYLNWSSLVSWWHLEAGVGVLAKTWVFGIIFCAWPWNTSIPSHLQTLRSLLNRTPGSLHHIRAAGVAIVTAWTREQVRRKKKAQNWILCPSHWEILFGP
jgi:hypothetical protein